jgi:hypothetical protein
MTNTDVCPHGGLRRKCEPCDLAEEVKELKAQLDAETKLHLEEASKSMSLVIGLKDEIERLRAALREVQTAVDQSGAGGDVDAGVLTDILDRASAEPKAPRIKPGDRVQNEVGHTGVVMTVGDTRACVQYDDGSAREPLLTKLRTLQAHPKCLHPVACMKGADGYCASCHAAAAL